MRRIFFILSVLTLVGVPVFAQSQVNPLVLFIVDEQLGTASPLDTEAEGVSALAEIFTNLGADVLSAKLDQPLPDTVQVVVIARPLEKLSVDALARLWTYLDRGHNLLLAIDPVGYNGVDAEISTSDLPRLLNSDYGIGLQDNFLVERWFTQETLGTGLEGSLLNTYAAPILHPVTQPLRDYDLPITTWGNRTIRVEPFGVNSIALPLLFTDSAYGETNTRSLTPGENAPLLELNLGSDQVGQLNIAALARNIRSGSYVVMLGDSQMVLDGFGLLADPTTGLPQHIGNRLLIERLAALLMDIPLEEWPGLPQGFTWLAVDGDASDWNSALPAVADDEDTTAENYNITQARAFHNDSYVYLLIETVAPAPADVRVRLAGASAEVEAVTITIQNGEIFVVGDAGETFIGDAGVGGGQVIELRLPLRITGLTEININELCLYDGQGAADAEAQDCLSQRIPVTQIDEKDPINLRFGQTLSVTVSDPNRGAAGLRDVPDLFQPLKALVNNGTVMAAIGRTEAGDWIQVQNATTGGWVETFTVAATGDLMALPVVP